MQARIKSRKGDLYVRLDIPKVGKRYAPIITMRDGKKKLTHWLFKRADDALAYRQCVNERYARLIIADLTLKHNQHDRRWNIRIGKFLEAVFGHVGKR